MTVLAERDRRLVRWPRSIAARSLDQEADMPRQCSSRMTTKRDEEIAKQKAARKPKRRGKKKDETATVET